MIIHEFIDEWRAELVLGELGAAHEVMIFNAAIDSRKVKSGAAFFAVRPSTLARCPSTGEPVRNADTGELVRKADQRAEFILNAVKNGAQLIVVEPDFDVDELALDEYVRRKIFVARVSNARRVFAELDARLNPLPPMNFTGVTGTNGKSSTVGITRDILRHLGANAFSVGTLGVIGNHSTMQLPDMLTTPEANVAHDIFRQLGLIHNATDIVAEVSSQGVVEERYGAVCFGVMAFTNFTQDHLDFHAYDHARDVIDEDGAMNRYFDAKLRALLEQTAPQALIVLNCEMARYEQCVAVLAMKRPDLRITTYGSAASGADLTYEIEGISKVSQTMVLSLKGEAQRVELPLLGRFQAENAACAVSMAVAWGFTFEQSVDALGKVRSIPGRMQYVGATPNGGRVFIDYAHTPDAIERVVANFKSSDLVMAEHLSLVFGCGGGRYDKKRPMMAKAAADANSIYLTDDNPRLETASEIRRQAMAGLNGLPDVDCHNVAGRAAAIALAIGNLPPGGVLVICGKGHEDYQEIRSSDDPEKEMRVPFSDFEEAQRALAQLR